jgi:hypothetical protein
MNTGRSIIMTALFAVLVILVQVAAQEQQPNKQPIRYAEQPSARPAVHELSRPMLLRSLWRRNNRFNFPRAAQGIK